MPTRFLVNQCQIITFFILKSGCIENSRIELKGIVLQVPSNQIKVAFIIILPFNLVHLLFFLFHIKIEGKCGWIIGGGAKGMLAPPLKLLGGGACPPPPPPPPPLPTPMQTVTTLRDPSVLLSYYTILMLTFAIRIQTVQTALLDTGFTTEHCSSNIKSYLGDFL